MLKIKLILRRLSRKKGLVTINMFGLSIAFCTILFLSLYIAQELSFDKHIPNHKYIYRLLSLWHKSEKTETLPINLSDNILQFKSHIPEVKEVVQIYRGGDSYFKVGDHVIAGNPTFQVDSTFFSVFDFKTIYGKKEGALNSSGKIVISRKTSLKVFGDQNPVGKSILVDGRLATVSAVIENIPQNTHFYFDVLKPITPETKAYKSLEFFTYVRFKENVDLKKAINKCEQRNTKALKERFRNYESTFASKLEPITSIHLKTIADFDLKLNGNNTLILFLIILSVTILIIALANYINLFMAQKNNLSRCSNIQSILGGNKLQAISHFFWESTIIITTSFIIALFVIFLMKRWVAGYIGITFISGSWQSLMVYLLVAGLMLFSVLIAGLYPAIRIGQMKDRLLSRSGQSKQLGQIGKNPLIVFQFTLVSFLIIGILSIHRQVKFIENKPKGFSSENVINYERITYTLINKWESVVNELRGIPHVVAVTGSHAYPGSGGSGQGISYNGSPKFSIDEARIQPGYLDVFGLQLSEGRFFDKFELEKNAIVLNRTAVEELGIKDPIGKFIEFDKDDSGNDDVEIIGVVNDYNYKSLRSKIAPLMLTNYRNDIYTISLKTDGFDSQRVINKVNAVLKQFDPNYRIGYRFFDDELSDMYASEHALRRIFYLGTVLGILVALVGLLGFVALVTQQRTKEIGIRKVNGAKVSEILAMLNKDFVKWVVIAFVIATPIAWYAMHKWLENFAYKTTMSWWIFALAGVLALGIALLTVSWQSWRAATRNPVEALRYE